MVNSDGFSPMIATPGGLIHDTRGREATPPASAPDRTSYRLTREDEARAWGAVVEWRRRATRDHHRPLPGDELAVRRIAASAIGCGLYELRGCEEAMLAAYVLAVVAGYPAGSPLVFVLWLAVYVGGDTVNL